MNFLITGAAGFIGSHVAEALLTQGHGVVGIDCLSGYYSPELKRHTFRKLAQQGAQVFIANLVSESFHGLIRLPIDYVIHFAAQPGNDAATPFGAYLKNNVVATHKLLEWAIAQPEPPNFINISTSSVYGLDATVPETTVPCPVSPYGVTKLAAEQCVLSEHRRGTLKSCSLRLFSVFGPRERPDKLYPKLIKALVNDTEFPLFIGALAHRRSFSNIKDIVSGVLAAVSQFDKAQGEVFNIGTDAVHTTAEAISTAEELFDKKLNVRLLPPRPGDQLGTHTQISKAKRLLGYQPKVSLKDGLAEMKEWYQKEVHNKIDY